MVLTFLTSWWCTDVTLLVEKGEEKQHVPQGFKDTICLFVCFVFPPCLSSVFANRLILTSFLFTPEGWQCHSSACPASLLSCVTKCNSTILECIWQLWLLMSLVWQQTPQLSTCCRFWLKWPSWPPTEHEKDYRQQLQSKMVELELICWMRDKVDSKLSDVNSDHLVISEKQETLVCSN